MFKLSFKQWLLLILLSVSFLDDFIRSVRTVFLDIAIILVIIGFILPDLKKPDVSSDVKE